jgi:hypothetical protein
MGVDTRISSEKQRVANKKISKDAINRGFIDLFNRASALNKVIMGIPVVKFISESNVLELFKGF